MAKPLVSDELWVRIKPLLPKEHPKPMGGRPRTPDRACLAGILFVLETETPWKALPAELECGSGMTCWRRLRDWHAAGVWDAICQVLLEELGQAGGVDWSPAALDGGAVRTNFGRKQSARLPQIAAHPNRSPC